MKEGDTVYVLVLNGGGIRGALTAAFLTKLEELLGQPLHDVFDMFVGTSIGGMMALALASNTRDARGLLQMYSYETANQIMHKSFWDRILPLQSRPKYDGHGKREVCKDILGGSLHMYSPDVKAFAVPTFDINKERVRTYHNTDGSFMGSTKNVYLYELADATSAAPTYFPSVLTGSGHVLVDGGLCVNNPSVVGLSLAKKRWGEYNIKVLNVGTGRKPKPSSKKYTGNVKWGAVRYMKAGLINWMMNQDYVVDHMHDMLGQDYLYVDVELDADINPSLDCTTKYNLQRLQEAGTALFDSRIEDIKTFFNIPS